MIVEAFDNAWHVLRHWRAHGYEYFVVEQSARVPTPRPARAEDVGDSLLLGVDYFPLPPLDEHTVGDNPDPERSLTVAEIYLAAAIAEGWEPQTV